MITNDILSKVLVYSKQELLKFIVANKITTPIIIVTSAGRSYEGLAINIAEVKEEGTVLVFRLKERGVLHINIRNIESIEFYENTTTLDILSKGNFYQPKEYDTSGKLKVKRTLQQFSDTILDKTKISVGVPEIIFPTDGQQLSRLAILTEQVQQIILKILQEEDARENWKSKYSKISFVEGKTLQIVASNKKIEIHFPFTDLKHPEIPEEELTTKILSVL